MSAQILILNGPNLNLLGQREPGHYGAKSLTDVMAECEALGKELGVEVTSYQSNSEGALVDKLQEAGKAGISVILNAGAYSHTSIALHDAIVGADVNVIEVHISNIHAREAFRHHSYISPVAKGVIVGCGTDGYLLGMRALINHLKQS